MLFKLLMAPLKTPVSSVNFVLRQVVTMAERELYSVQNIHEELLLLQLRLDEGEISEEAYAVQEADIMVRLRAAREHEQGIGR
ncbi:MAG: gas vesicle protein GvpG [Dehalococcoidia bacterium]